MDNGAFVYVLALGVAAGSGLSLVFGLGIFSAATFLAAAALAALIAFACKAPRAFLVSAALAFAPGLFTYLFLKFILLVVGAVNAVPFSSATVQSFPLWVAAACYVPLFAAAIFVYRQNAAPKRPN